jgi:hypothetical protein
MDQKFLAGSGSGNNHSGSGSGQLRIIPDLDPGSFGSVSFGSEMNFKYNYSGKQIKLVNFFKKF